MKTTNFNVTGYEVTANNSVKNAIKDFVVAQVLTNKKDCDFSCVLSLGDDDWKVISHIAKRKGEKNYHLVFGVYKHDCRAMSFGVDLDFGTLAGYNANKLIGQVTRLFNEVIEMMFDECGVLTTDEKYFADVKETIEEMVENETPHKRYVYSTYSSEYMHLFPNGINESDEIKYRVSHKVREYYEECMKKKLVKIYDPEGKMSDFEINELFRSYMAMLEAKWNFLMKFGKVNTDAKMANEEIENAVKNDAPMLDDSIPADNDSVNNDGPVLDDKYITLTALKERGWSESIIRKMGVEPDKTKRNPRNSCCEIKLYLLSRITEMEQTPLFKELAEKSRRRKESAGKAVQTMMEKIRAYCENITITIPYTSKESLFEDAVDGYNSLWADRGYYDKYIFDWRALSDSTLERIVCNYVRHSCTYYEEELEMLYGLTGIDYAHTYLKDKINGMVHQLYFSN